MWFKNKTLVRSVFKSAFLESEIKLDLSRFQIDVTHVGLSNILDSTIYSGKITWLDLTERDSIVYFTDVSEKACSIDRQDISKKQCFKLQAWSNENPFDS